ncbi:cytochrome c oxidase subunit VIc domain-containing protein [Phthorimaea operculella]|nr:cytochrome c oxidase subunit VIc domain-containing protein [Phthorimaea operculella]
MSCGPPCPPCAPPPPEPCPQVCTPPPPMPPCRHKPIMRGLHWAQTRQNLFIAMALATFGGLSYYFLVGRPRIARYKDFYEKAEFEQWADEMARKGLFQSVPKESLRE